MFRCATAAVVLLPILLTAAPDGDPVAAKLDAAVDAYKASMKTYREKGGAWLEGKEKEFRKAGDKKRVDVVHELQRGFRVLGDLPREAPDDVRRRSVDARLKLVKAYETAVKEWTKAGEDKKAAEADKTLAQVKDWLDISQPRRAWSHSGGEYRMIGRGKWQEKMGALYHPYAEYDRTAEYVELRSDGGGGRTNVTRLYEKAAEYRLDPDPNFAPAYTGKWLE